MFELKNYWQNYVGGSWIDGSGGRLPIENPGTGQVLAEQALADAADVERAVAAARDCHVEGTLHQMRPVERGRLVRGMGAYLLEQRDEIARVLTLESGKPLWEAELEVEGAARYFEYYGNQAETVEGRSIPLGADYFDFTVYEPFGVTAHIIPWNYPLEMTARSVSAALATGNTCVVKTPELDPLCTSYVAEAAEAVGLPQGALNLLCGYGPDAGAALSAHPQVRQIVFTGSVATGRAIARAAAENVVPCVLELGGKSAAVVYPDADLQTLIDSVRWGIYFNSGQVCSAMSRLIVHHSIHDEVVDAVCSLAGKLSVGPGVERTEFGDNMGSVISKKQLDRIAGMCNEAVAQGAVLAAGGKVMDQDGYFFEPTVLANVTPDMTIAREEVFGPVIAVLRFDQEEEAISIANSTDYGLVGGVFTRDLDSATNVATKMRAGQVFVNEWYAGGVETPFGGYGLSGYGREKGREALWNYVQTKNIAIKMGTSNGQ